MAQNLPSGLKGNIPMQGYDFKRLNHMMVIYRVVQIILVALLVYMAFHFQQLFASIGKPTQFFSSLVAAIVCQAILFYPAYLLSRRDVGIEVESCAIGITTELVAKLRKKRLLSDLWKCSVIIFFITFVAMVPDAKKASGAPLVLAVTIISFLLICLTYFNGFNFCAKKQIKLLS
jgi:hypothetical protein